MYITCTIPLAIENVKMLILHMCKSVLKKNIHTCVHVFLDHRGNAGFGRNCNQIKQIVLNVFMYMFMYTSSNLLLLQCVLAERCQTESFRSNDKVKRIRIRFNGNKRKMSRTSQRPTHQIW